MAGAGSGPTVLLSGAGGFVGSAVARRLSQAGFLVRALSRSPGRFAGEAGGAVRLPAFDAAAREWDALMDGVTHVVHCAGIARQDDRLACSEYEEANALYPERLASAARRRSRGRLVLVSSIRAMSGPLAEGTVREDRGEFPEDDYGRSKLEGEKRVATVFAGEGRHAVLRPTAVYGPGMKGSLRLLWGLARLPVPLPAGGLAAPRSLLDVEALAAAVLHLLSTPDLGAGPYIACDRSPVSVAEVLAAMRRGLGRRPLLFAPPQALFRSAAALAGRAEQWERLTGPLVADPGRLSATGWLPEHDTLARIAAYARTAF